MSPNPNRRLMLIRFSDRREARGEELAPCNSSISAAQMKLCTLKRRLYSTFPGDCSFSKAKKSRVHDFDSSVNPQFFSKYFGSVVNALSLEHCLIIQQSGFGGLLKYDCPVVLDSFVRWIVSKFDVRTSELVLRDRLINFSNVSVQKILGLPCGGQVLNPNIEAAKSVLFENFGVNSNVSVNHFGDLLLNKENLSENQVLISFLILSFGCFLCQTPSMVSDVSVLSCFKDSGGVKAFDWSSYIHQMVLRFVTMMKSGMHMTSHCSIGFTVCSYILAVLYLDCVNFGSFTISEEVPRIGFWSGSVLRHCCNLDKIKHGKYGKRPLKVSGNVSVPTNLKAYLDNLYGSLLPDELKVGICAIYDAHCSEEAIRFQQSSKDLISEIFSFCNELSAKIRETEKLPKGEVEVADAYEVPSKAEVDVACSVPNKSQIAETNPSHSSDGGLISLHLGYHSVSSGTNDEDTKVCSTHDNNCAQQIYSNDEALIVDLCTPGFINGFNGSLNASRLAEDRNAPMKQNMWLMILIDNGGSQQFMRYQNVQNILNSISGASNIHGSRLYRSIDYVPDTYSPISREKYFSMRAKKVPKYLAFDTVAKSTCDGDMKRGPIDVVHIADGDNPPESKSNLVPDGDLSKGPIDVIQIPDGDNDPQSKSDMKNNDEVQFVRKESSKDTSRALVKESEKLYNAGVAEGSKLNNQFSEDLDFSVSVNPHSKYVVTEVEKRAYLGVLKLGVNKNLKRYIGGCHVTYQFLTNSMKSGSEVGSFVINAFCRKLFMDHKPKFSKKHYFFSSAGAGLMKVTNNFSYIQKSFDGASSALQLSKADMNKNFTFLDSLYSENDEYHIKVREILLPNFMKVWYDYVITPIEVDNFPYVYPVVPKQANKTDCGVFVLKFLQFWTPQGHLCSSFSQADIDNIRIQLVTDLLFSEHNTEDTVREFFGQDGCPRAGKVRNGPTSRKFK
ncbi:hypothetical protein ACP4OV_021555 [Aristida adscensionis]